MCPVWGSDEAGAISAVAGVMDVDASRRILDEVMAAERHTAVLVRAVRVYSNAADAAAET